MRLLPVLDFEAMSKNYDTIYDAADKLFKEYNPCQYNDKGVCVAGWQNGCCGSCLHLGPHGCTVKSLACKLYWCGAGLENTKENGNVKNRFGKKLSDLRDAASDTKTPMLLFATKECAMFHPAADRKTRREVHGYYDDGNSDQQEGPLQKGQDEHTYRPRGEVKRQRRMPNAPL